MRRAFILCLMVILTAVYVLQAVVSLPLTSPTRSEVHSIAKGLDMLHHPVGASSYELPPLFQAIAGLANFPLRSTTASPEDGESFAESLEKRILSDKVQTKKMVAKSRLVMILLGAIVCMACFAWSYELFGPVGALFSLCLLIFSPNFLAHSRLVSTHAMDTAAFFLGVYFSWRFVRFPSIISALTSGLVLGAFLLGSFSSLILVPIILLCMSYHYWVEFTHDDSGGAVKSLSTTKLLFLFVVLFGVCAAVVFVPYRSTGYLSYVLDTKHWLTQVPNGELPYYLLGRFRTEGFEEYFFGVFLLKSSPGILLASALVFLVPIFQVLHLAERTRPMGPDDWLFILAPFFTLATLAVLALPQDGIDRILPLYPFLCVLLGSLSCTFRSSAGKILMVIVLAVQVESAGLRAGEFVSYFNGLLRCDGRRAISCLDARNIDIGQDIELVAKNLKRFRTKDVQVVILPYNNPPLDTFIENWRPMRLEEILKPEPALYAVSVHRLNRLLFGSGRPNGVDWFRDFDPVAKVGNTYYIYDFRTNSKS